MAQIEIPKQWRKEVCVILGSGKSGSVIQWTVDARNRYEADSKSSWEYEVYDAFTKYLTSPQPVGCAVTMDTPPGETYEFLFPFKGTTFYGKILLRTDRRRLVVFSCHLPLKDKLCCE